MGTGQESEQVIRAWAQQRIWSLSANRLKRRIDQARLAALLLGIATAVLAVAADQIGGLSMPGGRALSAAAAITAGLATLLQRRASTGQIRDWTRARSASEGLKTEIYSYLGGGTAYTGPGRDQRLGAETRSITEAVSRLQRHTLGIEPDTKPLPAVHDAGSYIAVRVNDQIRNYYTPKAAVYETRVRRLRTVGDLLGVTAVVLAAAAAAFQVGGLAAWVPVVTTIGTSVAAYITAAHYDHLVIEFLRTAQRLEHLLHEHLDNPASKRRSIHRRLRSRHLHREPGMDGPLKPARPAQVTTATSPGSIKFPPPKTKPPVTSGSKSKAAYPALPRAPVGRRTAGCWPERFSA
jgi:SMODS and SLOG-associating 2TM effector domain 1/Protein of unknown function (DUF4231)